MSYLIATVITGLWILGFWLMPVFPSRTGCSQSLPPALTALACPRSRSCIGRQDHRHGRLQVGGKGAGGGSGTGTQIRNQKSEIINPSSPSATSLPWLPA